MGGQVIVFPALGNLVSQNLGSHIPYFDWLFIDDLAVKATNFG